jgi:TonB-dependent starch-binding outer membrane protein SusC
MPGVSIVLKGSQIGTVSDHEGNYKIAVPYNEGSLVFSFIGYTTVERSFTTQSVIDVLMESDSQMLGEIVVVGYGEQKKSDVTGSISSVSGKIIERLPVASVDDALSGRSAGVQISKQSGTPGTGVSVRIRGTNSISGSIDPLYVVDGIPMIAESNSKVNASDTDVNLTNTKNNSLADINPSDVASIEILKDASATAIYGSRGSNGVVLITTKRGKTGDPIINLNHFTGIQLGTTNKIEMMGSREFIDLMDEAAQNDGLGEKVYIDANDPKLQNTKWYDEILKPAGMSQTQFSMQGGTSSTRYYTSAAYFNQDGVQIGTGFKRFNGRLNLDVDLTPKVTIGTSIGISRSNMKRTETDASFYGVVVNAQAGDPLMPVYEKDGSYANPFLYGSWWMVENPVKSANEYDRHTYSNRLLSTFYATYKILPSLSFKTSWSIDYTDLKDEQAISSITYESIRAGAGGFGQYSTYQDLTWLNENVLTFDKTFGDHHLSSMLGFSKQESQRDDSDIRGRHYPIDGYGKLGGAGQTTATSGWQSWGLQSYFARVNYSYKEKYLFTLTTRADGSSRFGENNRYGVFPSGSFAWRLSEESFLSTSSLISDLKLRTSYGVTGNQEGIPNYASRGLWTLNAAYNGYGGISPSKPGVTQYANPNLTWEKTKQTNIGFDLGLWANRLTLTTDAFVSNTEDLLFNVPVPGTSGAAYITQNSGKIKNKGIEFSLNTINTTGALGWNSGFNISFIRNKVVDVLNNGELQHESHILLEGKPLGTFNLIHFIGVDPQTGDAIFEDVNKDGIINSDDAKVAGSAQPDFFGGLSNTLNYKNFTLDIFLQFTQGNKLFNRSRTQIEQVGYNFLYFSDDDYNSGNYYILPNGNNATSVRDRWKKPGDVTDIPRASLRTRNFYEFSDKWLEDASYLRVKNIQLAYNVPAGMLGRTKFLKSLRIYLQAQNLLTFTKYKGFDPEVETSGNLLTQGQDYAGFGQVKTISAGFNMGL